jgi:tetratricopeptide (TPR) repeat protein
MPIDREAVLRTAERLLRQGKLDGAIAEYIRLTDDQPRDWNSINTLGDLYVRAGRIDRAVAQFVRIADHLFDEGFLPKAAALYKKALKVKQDHEHTLFRLSEIAAQQGLLADAKLYLRQLIQQRQNRGDERGVAECVVRLGTIDEDDADAKMAAARAARTIGDIDGAIRLFQEAATAWQKQNREGEAADALIGAAELRPDDEGLRATVARTLVAAGQLDRAQPFLTTSAMGDDPDLLLAVARRDLLDGRAAQAHAAQMRAVAMAPDRQEQVLKFADELLAADRVEEAFGCTDVVVDAALLECAFDRAARLLNDFLARRCVIAGLLKLVDVYVDAGLDERITAVQAQLADAYLDQGQPAAARVVAEDLLAREPGAEMHQQRLRRALIALGVDDVEEVIARQLEAAPIFSEPFDFGPAADPVTPPESPDASGPAVGTRASESSIDVEPDANPDVLSQRAASPVLPEPGPSRESYEIDLSAALAGLHSATPAPAVPAVARSNESVSDNAAQLFEQAQQHLQHGATAEALALLQAAARVPQFRFKASAQLGRLLVSRGDLVHGIEWLERAASASSGSQDESFAILYDLGDALERSGEPVRALALFMELEAEANAYRDVRMRIDHLTSGVARLNGDRA